MAEPIRFIGWPAVMTKRTAAAYLDCLDSEGKMRPTFREWTRRDGFPEPRDGQYLKRDLDYFLARWFGTADPVSASRDDLDKMFGT